MKKFTLYWPALLNIHLTKDVGIIPFIMQKHFGYKSNILTYNNDDYSDNEKYLENLEINFLKDNHHNQICRINDIISNILNTDVLMLIGIYDFNLEIIDLYKKIKPNGKIYLKLDANIGWIMSINNGPNLYLILDKLRKCDLITVESERLKYLILLMWNIETQYMPNGSYNFYSVNEVKYEDKENIILFAGRIGVEQKHNELLVEAFERIENEIKEWKIEFAGTIEPEFNKYLEEKFSTKPILKERIKLLGFLSKYEVESRYCKAKICCITSRWESCANSYAQAISCGCYIISTDVDGAIDIIDYGKYGRIIPIENIQKLEEALVEVCNNKELIKENTTKSQKYAREKICWIKLCSQIQYYLDKHIK